MKPQFKQLNDEFNEFYKFLKDNKYTDAEIAKLLSPLTSRFTKKYFKILIAATVFFAILYFSTYIETVSWHFSAIGRIFLIKLLPFWDWTKLKNEKCLIYKSTTPLDNPIFNCELCENIQRIDVFDEISEDLIKKKYLEVDNPVIVKESWPYDSTFLEKLGQNNVILNSKPCYLATNTVNGIPRIKTLLQRLTMFDSFILHFQNCDFGAMKQFRGFMPRLKFLPPELSPVQYNWLMWSKNYNMTHFKRVPLVEKVAVVGQILGEIHVRLVPRKNCDGECPDVEVMLKAGESLVFSNLWDLEYRPGGGENLGAILELH